MAYTIRRAAPTERSEVVALLAELLPGEDVERRYDWMHLGNPAGASIVWFAIDAHGEIAGCASYFPRAILADGKQVRAALGGDCWVRPKFRRQGLAAALHAEGRREMRAEGFEVMFGTPTKANETPLLKNGAKNIGHVIRYARPLEVSGIPLSRRVLAHGWGSARLEPIVGVDRRVDEVWARTAPELAISTVRDAVFYDWRFTRSPSGKQRAFVIVDRGVPIATCALEELGRSLNTIDLVVPRARFGAALGALVRHAGTHHPRSAALSLRLCLEESNRRALWRYGLLPREQVVLNVLLPEGEPRAALFYDPARWYVTLADTDLDHS
jgi:hypothetical protein